jgi:hypothetical protein
MVFELTDAERRWLARLTLARQGSSEIAVDQDSLTAAETSLLCALPPLVVAALAVMNKNPEWISENHRSAKDEARVPRGVIAFAPTGVDGGYFCLRGARGSSQVRLDVCRPGSLEA